MGRRVCLSPVRIVCRGVVYTGHAQVLEVLEAGLKERDKGERGEEIRGGKRRQEEMRDEDRK